MKEMDEIYINAFLTGLRVTQPKNGKIVLEIHYEDGKVVSLVSTSTKGE